MADQSSDFFDQMLLKYPVWQREYAAAMTETDDLELSKKIRDAEDVLLRRKSQLEEAGRDGNAEELLAIRDARGGLNILRKELDDRHGIKRIVCH